ncbi:Ig-like domain-containing protein [Rubrivirga sp. IMCC43871]|uniref:Ig-like domain-containing protein n=1 Tax=Rubrivirga sp. IMCC43871 TaxID=3391575 RepID=UPI0039900BA3
MSKFLTLGLLALVLVLGARAPQAQVTGLSDWDLFIDPGHSGTAENVGIYGYSEPQKVLRVGLALREMLLSRTDIDTVYMSRTTDAEVVGLSQRTDMANALGADFYHSIHSNAGSATANNVLMLYGGWRLNGQTVEKTPEGGGRMGDEYEEALSAAMRLPTIGNYADRTFYQGFPDTHDNQFPYLSVNRRSAMASVLSEGGFHTNPRQNQLNMNAEWKRMEAQAFYWAILDWHGVPRSTHRIATGIVTDAESGRPVNGATVTIDGQTYTTDTYASLFNRYSSDPDQLANGFYYLEDLGAGTHTVTVEAEGYETATAQVTMLDTEFSFADVQIVSNVPPVLTDADPAEGEPNFPVTDPLRFTFSRPLDPATATPAFSLTRSSDGSAVSGTVSYEAGGTRLVFTPDAPLVARTEYVATLAGTAATANGSLLDGDGDGTGGDALVVTFTSSFPDTDAPRLSQSSPRPNATDVELRPVVTVAFDEPVVAATLDGRVTLENATTGTVVAGRFEHALAGVVGDDPMPRSTVSFVPDASLAPATLYRFAIEPGVEDAYLNASAARYAFTFRTGSAAPLVTVVEAFEGSSIVDNWWVPAQSGSTAGIVPDSTNAAASARAHLLGGTTSMRIDYGWDAAASSWLIREYLNGGPPRAVTFDATATLRARVFGDGNGTLFRFAVDDASGTEVSPWVVVDWYGWQPIEWDMTTGETGEWIGNGVLEGTLRFDSIQLGYDGTSPVFGELYVDDLELTRPGNVATEGGFAGDAPLEVLPARPNPFRTRTEIAFRLASPADVTVRVFNALGQQVAVLADREAFAGGAHVLTWDAASVAAGVYVARVEAGAEQATVRMVMAR